jgi:DNA-binding MarR family transcriptional regulator
VTAEDSAAAQAWQAMRSLVLDSNDKREAVSAALGMSFIRAKALRHLAPGPMSMSELAKSLATDASYTSIVVEDLAARGLVGRSVHPADRRVKIVTITATGLDAAQQAERIIGAPPPAFRALAEERLATLLGLLYELLSIEARSSGDSLETA